LNADPFDVEDEREAAIRALFPLVRSIGVRIARVVRAADLDDLIGDGSLGAVRAVDSFDPRRGPSLVAYARRLITGAMLNGLRRVDPVSERVRRTLRIADRKRYTLANALGRLPTLGELERHDPALRRARIAAHRNTPISLDAAPASDGATVADWSGEPSAAAMHAIEHASLHAALARLPLRQRQVVTLHYYGELSLHAIGRRLKISPQRCSQLHATALARLRAAVPGG